MSNCKPTVTPLIPNQYLCPETDKEKEKLKSLQVNYKSAIGSINYVSSVTCPDLCFAVSTLSQYLEPPGIQHWKSFLHVLRYLKGGLEVGLNYPKSRKDILISWSDADRGNCMETRRSIIGFLSTFNGCLVLWKTRKQPSVSTSITEAEYKAL
ncbi:hypothetical protein O181_019256 [Austropuccinia psidii MF-1]|uniref:Reverse transcriptase Ty1/copia-type domain-containing protein n=1 Tax=Austropuccinia psidii MF-1 TaxID=1389203 RepID=A0A9Q3CB65_9BASI|nr:hypothetical protein [Austropuccinia psidii MF-1]